MGYNEQKGKAKNPEKEPLLTEGTRISEKSTIGTDGKQLLLRIPNEIAEQLEIKVGDEFVFEVTISSGEEPEIRFEIEKGKTRRTIEEVVKERKKKACQKSKVEDGKKN